MEQEMTVVTVAAEPLLAGGGAEDNPSSHKKPNTWMSRTATCLNSPKSILLISTLYLTGYLSFITVEGGFSSQFVHFGPGTDSTNTTMFLGIVLDTWPKVYLMYFVSFLSSVMSTYYGYAMSSNLHSYIWNRALKTVPFSKRWTYVVILAEPILMTILGITQFFTNLTMQLQFILPQFVGSLITEIPFTIQRLREKEYEFP
jgi:hypothetical protein